MSVVTVWPSGVKFAVLVHMNRDIKNVGITFKGLLDSIAYRTSVVIARREHEMLAVVHIPE